MSSFFEGPEKKVELVVTAERANLRQLGDDFWQRIVRSARAEVLSKTSTEHLDALLLSESSLFVYDDHITMITCGRTTLVDAVLQVIDEVGAENVALLVYERKNEHFPEHQLSSFYDDARRLAQVIPGEAVRFGDEHDHRIFVFHSSRPYASGSADTTLEVLMHGIDADRARVFHFGDDPPSRFAADAGLDALLPGFQIDEHAFSPAGYSLNAVRDGLYYTIHVTPEAVGSYVSFETNFDFRERPNEIVARVVEWFSPDSFDVLSFCPQGGRLELEIPGFALRKRVREQLCSYDIDFYHYFQPSTGPARAFPLEL